MDSVIFRLVEPCENTFSFEVQEKNSLVFNYIPVCENALLFEEVCEPYIVINAPTLCFNLIEVEEPEFCPELVFNWTCKVGEDYLYLVTSTGHFFDTVDNKQFILKKI